jgi:hypothetical protein
VGERDRALKFEKPLEKPWRLKQWPWRLVERNFVGFFSLAVLSRFRDGEHMNV